MGECSAISIVRAAALAGTAIALLAVPAAAQVSSDPQETETEAGSGNGLQEIVVTAERRETNLQDTPLSIIAVTEEAVAAKGIEDLQDLATFTPNLSISASRGNGNNIPNF